MTKLMDHEQGRIALLELNNLMIYRRVPYFLIQGTALGAYRDKGFTPTEKDIDVGILIEDFMPKYRQLMIDLKEFGFDVTTRSKPFNRERIIVAKRDTVKIDITTYVPWKSVRFCANTDPALHYTVVYQKQMIEEFDCVKVFGHVFRTPYPIEDYLDLEYGPDWRTPKDDSVSRTRHYHFVKSEGIPDDYLDQFETKHSRLPFG